MKALAPREIFVAGTVIAQGIPVAALVFLDPGFDKPNALGLDFGFVIAMAITFSGIWITGLVSTFSMRRHRTICITGYALLPLFWLFAVFALES